MLNPLKYQFTNTLNKYGYNAIVNGQDEVKVLFKEYAEGTSTTEFKYMFFRNGLIKQGDIITIFDDNWLVLHEDITINDVYTRVIIRRLKFKINFNFTGEVISFHSAIDEGTYRISTNEYITLQDGRIVLIMQENEHSKRISLNQRFLIMGSAWKVIQKTNSEHGIYKIYADIDIFNDNDDKENEIADRWKYETKNNYTIVINNVVDSPLPLDSTLQLDITVTNNGELVEVPLTYTSSNIGVLTVDDTGLITCVGIGTANITVAVTDDLTITDTIAISVEEVAGDNFTITITGKDSFYPYENDIPYTATVYNGGVEVSDKDVTFEIDDTSLATIKSQDGKGCIIKPNSDFRVGVIILKATLIDDVNIFAEKEILVAGL